MSVYFKDPDDVLDYKFDYAAATNGSGSSDWLASGDTISTHSIIADSGITVDSSSITDTNTSVTVWLSGGTEDTDYGVTCRIETTGGRIFDKTIRIKVRQR